MKNLEEVVFIFKANPEGNHSGRDPYSEELEKKGFITKVIPVLDFTYKNIDVLKCKLCQPELYSGLILTSPRCVRAVMKAVEGVDGVCKQWQRLQTFAVGEATARLIRDSLGLDPEGSAAGNGFTLAPIILESKPEKPLLLPCGNLKMDTLENLLTEGGVSTESVEVYETVAHPKLESYLKTALAEHNPAYIVYFSPSGVQNTYPLLCASGVDMEKMKWVSIGPTTAAALESLGLQVHCAAAKPTPHDLAEAVADALLKN